MDVEKKILSVIQKDFPLERRPFLRLAEKVGLDEEFFLEKIRELQKKNIIRQVSAVFNPSFFGHKSGLFAVKAKEKDLFQTIEIINSHNGVSHNYLRDHAYNLWFILVVPPGKDLLAEAEALCKTCQVKEYLFLPALKVFKISTVVWIEPYENEKNDVFENQHQKESKFSERDVIFVKHLQEPLPLIKEPFKIIAEKLGVKEDDIFSWMINMQNQGGLRRFGALVKHDRLGYKTNVMVAWKVPEEKIESFVKEVNRKTFITHCYERKTYPFWEYNLYTMCHFKNEEEKNWIKELAQRLKINDYLMLNTLKELKKVRLKLFYDRVL
ncbi:Lrp/AsnC family transcriptional regulator [Thermodesulfobacterium sp. TA1]|uniref:siroheme decarboxylase subunit alpha n=1 Tax=Thermodesulfobacterium sp. TA1 TaxID=2234087 RepID=UPI001232C22A|nr:Lrp/AsnC family transcriptional regulator [Thermodesulfobacterium sp. TA1]QER41814.1 Lrp/AsnC family transcriptional regulator [Thermodesulfobacterium sp. TA1]